MQELISELTRLYLPAGAVDGEALARQFRGQSTSTFGLTDSAGHLRALVIPFDKSESSDEGQHWSQLCTVANALQSELGFPAPAVSISGAGGYRLWLSLETPVPAAQAQEFLRLLRQAYLPGVESRAETLLEPVELPPCLHRDTGKWAAFIHPGLGASFADDGGLEMAPPLSAQAGFLEALQSITASQFERGLDLLRQSHGAAAHAAPAPARAALPYGLLLKDATLEDIIRHLHSKNIEPTFRHLLP